MDRQSKDNKHFASGAAPGQYDVDNNNVNSL